MTDRSAFMGAMSMDSAVPFTRTAVPSEIDALGHVNNAVYVRWVQDAAVAHWEAIAAGTELEASYVWVCLRHEIDYRAEVLPGEEVTVKTWLGKRDGARFDRHTDIRKTGSDRWSAKGLTTWVLIDRVTGRPKRVPQGVLDAFGVDGRAED